MATASKDKQVPTPQVGKRAVRNRKSDWQPMDGVAIDTQGEKKTSGVKIRGTGAATKGVTARGPMA